jgi:hypothetical protein
MNKDGSRTLHNTKSKESEPLTPIRFRLDGVTLPAEWNDDDGQPQTSAVLVADGSIDGAPVARLTDAQSDVLDVVRELARDSGRVSRDEVTAVLTDRGLVTDRQRRHRVLSQLIEKGALLRQGDDFLDPERLAQRVAIGSPTVSVH